MSRNHTKAPVYRIRTQLAVLALLTFTPWLRGQTPAPADAAVEARVNEMLAKLTASQKLELLGGHNGFFIHDEPSIGLPALRMADGPVGIRGLGPSTAYPAGIALAATFDADLAFAEGQAIGRDAHARGIAFLLGPGVNLYRAPMNGRNFEYFGEDPYLTSRIAVGYIQGLQQQGVSATVKHFALNNEEYDRHNIDSVVDEQTLHELYLPSFEAAVHDAHVNAVMDSYNLVNGIHAWENAELNATILKKGWGFSGIVVSDWNSVTDGLAAANTALDIEMPSAKYMNATTLLPALESGALSQATVDDKVRRILRVAVRMGWMEHPPVPASAPVADDVASRNVARRVALESITLLKNDRDLLPLDAAKVCTLAVIGPNADTPVIGGSGSAQVTPYSAPTLVEALSKALPKRAGCDGVVYRRGLPTYAEIFRTTSFTHGVHEELFNAVDLSGTAAKADRERLEPAAVPSEKPDALHSGRWVADYMPTATGPVLIFAALGHQDTIHLAVDGKQTIELIKPEGRPIIATTVNAVAGKTIHLELTATLHDNPEAIGLGVRPLAAMVSDEARALAAKADAVVIAAGYDPHTEGEGFDRSFDLPGGQNELIRQIGAANKNTVVAVDAGGGFNMEPWLNSVGAVFHLWYPGQDGAPAFADLLFGNANPEGHLPISIEHSFAENPAHDSYFPGPGSTAGHPVLHLNEGVFLGYRYYATEHVKPLFPFGYGLSYTSFAFSHLHVDPSAKGVTVTVDVKNSGTRAGGEAVQIYVGDPSATVRRPAEELKAFRKVHLEPKEQQHLEFTLDRRALSWWNPEKHAWQLDPGRFTVLAGDASDNVPLSTDFEYGVAAAQTTAASPSAASSPATPAVPASVLFPTNPAPAYNGTKEWSLTVTSTKVDHSDGKENWSAPQQNRTRVMEQLAGFVPKILPTDIWGGRLDISDKATGFFYTKKINGRWWAFDPGGHAYLNIAVVELSPGPGDNAKAALAKQFGDSTKWMSRTHALLLQNGFDAAGAWSNVNLIRSSSLQSNHPLAYTVILNFMADYGKKRGGLHDTPGHAGFPHDTIFVFDPEFPKFADEYAKQIAKYADDPNLFGYFSDNELPLNRNNLDGYLQLPHSDAGYIAAKKFLDEHHASDPTDDLRKEFLAYEVDLYYSIVSKAIHANDPHHMYIGSRITGKTEQCNEVFRVLGKYADAISVNYYNSWTPDTTLLAMWEHESQKPEIITEFYVKGNDSGMPNKTGAGWLVPTQADRGAFYQNYTLTLLQSKSIIGWQWFKYQDNDPLDPHAELSNRDANKGIVNVNYQLYAPLLERMRQLNPNAYALADYFDTRKP